MGTHPEVYSALSAVIGPGVFVSIVGREQSNIVVGQVTPVRDGGNMPVNPKWGDVII